MGNNEKHNYKLEKKNENSDVYFIDCIEIAKNELQSGVEITWYSDDTEFEIWFPKGQNPFSNANLPEQALLNSRGRRVKKRVHNNVEPGTYFYSIFCKKTNTMAECSSPPRMIVR